MYELFTVETTINGKTYRRVVEPRTLLCDFIRQELELTGTHVGCEHGVCGACTVLVEGKPVRSCLMFTPQVHQQKVETVESLSPDIHQLSVLQEAFQEKHALQCGFCTPGILMTMKAFLEEVPDPTEEQIRKALSGNLCRCTGYENIVEAVALAAIQLRDGKQDVRGSNDQ
ncbi:MAG: (2Fe-2S)-binding protein [Methyloligellaceae bacterium]